MSPDDVMEVARLKGRVIALEAQVQTLEAEAKVYEAMRRAFAKSDSQEVTRLKAEVERLRKAGDAMHRAIKVSDPALDWAIECWNAAKEGKPSEQKSPSFIEDLGNGVEKHDLLFRHPAKEGKQPCSDKHITDKFVSVDRYYISGLHPHIWKHPEGEMVYFDDYVNLWVEKERLKAEVERLRKELADAQENYHLVNEMVARLRKEGKPPSV